jgi:Uma2 family endonuclease
MDVLNDIFEMEIDGYEALLETMKVEFFEGRAKAAPPLNSTHHQYVQSELFFQLRQHMDKMKRPGQLFLGPIEVFLDEESRVAPDIFYFNDFEYPLAQHMALHRKPEVIFEIVSTGSHHKDNNEKFFLYQKHQIREYWLVYPHHQTVSVFGLGSDGTFESIAQGVRGGSISAEKGFSRVIKGFTPDLEGLFARLEPKKRH